ncbi:hypothetical protein CsSME_00035873 [Camellia sinensis var. sinensis]
MGTIVGNVEGKDKCVVDDVVIDVDAVVLRAKKWYGIDINNRFDVWKMMMIKENTKITKAYDQPGDRAIMWADSTEGVAVYFTDVKDLVRQNTICCNVIDAYAELLKLEQLKNVCE